MTTLSLVEERNWPILRGRLCNLAVLRPGDAAAWKSGEDAEQIRWFDFPAPAPLQNVVVAIHEWRRNWSANGPIRHWGIWDGETLAGGVELRLRSNQQRMSQVSWNLGGDPR